MNQESFIRIVILAVQTDPVHFCFVTNDFKFVIPLDLALNILYLLDAFKNDPPAPAQYCT